MENEKEKNVLLNVDIGNTTTVLALCRNQKVIKVYTIDNYLKVFDYKMALLKTLKSISRNFKVDGVMLCSVVPKLQTRIAILIHKSLNIKPIIVGKDFIVPIINCYKNKKQVGQDRLVCAYAVKQLYGFPAIIIDFGTAITFDVITQKGDYDGGMIVPGIKMSTESLFAKTALLPKVHKIEIPKRLVGKTTQESILSGIFYGYGSMCNGLIDQISKNMKVKLKVVVTGGHIKYMKKFIQKKITANDPYLIFKGLSMIYDKYFN